MNELIQPEFEMLMDNAPADQRPEIAKLIDLVEEYEHGNFARTIDYLDLFTAIKRANGDRFHPALSALLRIVRYAAELARVKAHDSTLKETET